MECIQISRDDGQLLMDFEKQHFPPNECLPKHHLFEISTNQAGIFLLHNNHHIGIITYMIIHKNNLSILPYSDLYTNKHAMLCIVKVYIEEEYRGQGWSKYMFDYFFKICPPVNIHLQVRINNKVAISLYKKIGFHVVGIRKRYYINPTDDAYLMLRPIK